jgi:hypothetical protein
VKTKELLDKIAKLEARIAELEARPATIHHHYHYGPQQPDPVLQPAWPNSPAPGWPLQPPIINGSICGPAGRVEQDALNSVGIGVGYSLIESTEATGITAAKILRDTAEAIVREIPVEAAYTRSAVLSFADQ